MDAKIPTVVGAPGFEYEHPHAGVIGEPSRQYTTGRPASDDDFVYGTLDHGTNPTPRRLVQSSLCRDWTAPTICPTDYSVVKLGGFMRWLWVGVCVLGFSSCVIVDDACESQCRDWGDFWDACGDTLVEDFGVHSLCYDDPKSMVNENGELEEPEDFDHEENQCESGRDATRSCLGLWRAQRRAASDIYRDSLIFECEQESEYKQMIRDEDCDGVGEEVTGSN